MKLFVQTTGQFQLMDFETHALIRHEGYTVVTSSHFLQMQIGRSQIEIVSALQDEATDEEWLKYLAESDGDLELARDSFLSTFGPEPTDKSDANQKQKGPKGKPV